MAASNMADHVGRVLGDRYRVLAPLGSGASARVYLAEDVALRRQVAVKILHPSLADDPAFLKRFRAEAQAAAALSHPHVVAVFDWGEEEIPYLVTEALGGGSLRALLDRGRRLTPSQALLVGLEAARGLDYAHRRGFVHRDIKPGNLLFDTEGRLRVADFGLARALAEAAWTEPAGVVLGTARYASPEQARGHPVDGRSDVYSLALVLIEAVTGTVPFAADTTVATLMARLDTLMRVPAELGPLAPVLERAGRPDPGERYTAGELARALVQAAERLPRPERLPLASAPLPGTVVEEAVDPTALGFSTGAVAPVAPVPPPTRNGNGNGVGHGPRSDDTTIGAAPVVAGGGGRPTPPAVLYDEEAHGGRRSAPRRRRRRWPWAVLVVLLLAAGGGGAAWALLRETVETFALPDLTELTEAELATQPLFAEADLVLDKVYVRVDGTTPGQVLDQSPAAGEVVEEDSIIQVTISEGQVPKPVPDLTNTPQADAEAALAALGFSVGVVTPVPHEEAPVGVVLDWSHKGTEQEPGAVVDLAVSSGPAPRVVPEVVGATLEEATAALAAVQLGVSSTEVFSDDVERGRIISATPPAGESVERGAVVAVVVSRGVDLVVVPDVSGQDQAAAVDALRNAGLREGEVTGRAGRPVLVTEPRAGASVRRGTTVDMVVG